MSITPDFKTLIVGANSFEYFRVGPRDAVPVIFLHGWPEDATAWTSVIALLSSEYDCIAINLPGIGGSSPLEKPNTEKFAQHFLRFADQLGLGEFHLVGHDIGGMIAYATARMTSKVRTVSILNTVVPGVDPWDRVIANPWLWHFAFHSIPGLPELLTTDHIAEYFDYFFDGISSDRTAISSEHRAHYSHVYAQSDALSRSFDWYRQLWTNAQLNARPHVDCEVPLLYIRGASEFGDIIDYVEGFSRSGMKLINHAIISDAGHFSPEENPAGVVNALENHFSGVQPS